MTALSPNPNPANKFSETEKKDSITYDVDEFTNYGEFKIQYYATVNTNNLNNTYLSPSTSTSVTNGKLQLDSGSTLNVNRQGDDQATGNFINSKNALFEIGGQTSFYNLDNKGNIETYKGEYEDPYIVITGTGYNHSEGKITLAADQSDVINDGYGFKAVNFTNDGNITVSNPTCLIFGELFDDSKKGLINNGTFKTVGRLSGQILNSNSVDATGFLNLQIENKANSKFNYVALDPDSTDYLPNREGYLYLSNDYNATTTINSSYDPSSTPLTRILSILSLDNTGDLILGNNAAAALSSSKITTQGSTLPLVNQSFTTGGNTQTGKIIISKSATLVVDDRARQNTIFTNNGTILNKGKIINNATIDNRKGQIIGQIDNEGGGKVIGPKLTGNGTIIGNYENIGIFAPGTSSGGHLIDGNLTNSVGSVKEIELGGTSDAERSREDSEFDFIDVTGNLDIRGGSLEVSLIDGFKLGRNQEFIISKVDGEVTGTYSGLVEGALVGKFDSIYGAGIQQDLYITYATGDGNDIGLYTTKSVDRLYNTSEGKHLLSSNENEIDILTGSGWVNEGISYSAPEQPTAEVFRFYIASENRHFYTALESERDIIIGDETTFSDWEYEGSAFSAYSTNDFPEDAVAVVRYLNEESGNHVYSTSTFEQGILDQDSNWLNEGIAWYGDALSVLPSPLASGS